MTLLYQNLDFMRMCSIAGQGTWALCDWGMAVRAHLLFNLPLQMANIINWRKDFFVGKSISMMIKVKNRILIWKNSICYSGTLIFISQCWEWSDLWELLLEDRADGHTGLHGPVSC